MTTVISWTEGEDRSVDTDALGEVLAEVTDAATEPVIVSLRAEGAEVHIVVGDPAGTALVYYPPGYTDVGVGSLHSVGDPDAAKANAWQPPLTAYYFGHHTEFPRWSVIQRELGERALAQFCEQPTEPPSAVLWEPD